MKIHGLQKMTLLDFPGKVACTVFLGGCDLRCPFCHNAELIDGTAPAVMDETELLAFLEKRKGLIDGVAITGGEPLLRGEELVTLAKENGVELTAKEAEAYLSEFEDVDLDSAQMKKVAGGSCYDVGSTGCGDKGANPRP